MSVSLAQFVGCEGSSFQTNTNPRVGGYFGIRILGRCKTSFCGLGMGAVIRRYVENIILCSVLFCPHLAGGTELL